MAMFPAIVFVRLRTAGELVLPLIGRPRRASRVGGPWPVLPAFVVAVAVGVLIGAVAYLAVFRLLRDAPPVTPPRRVGRPDDRAPGRRRRPGRDGDRSASTRSCPPTSSRSAGASCRRTGCGSSPSSWRWARRSPPLYRFTRFGLATRAAAENAKGAILMGHSPDRLGLGNWMLAAFVASVAGVLMSPISGVNPFNYSLFVVPALAAALAGRLRSFAVAMAAGVAIGMFEGLAVHLVSRAAGPRLPAQRVGLGGARSSPSSSCSSCSGAACPTGARSSTSSSRSRRCRRAGRW